MYGTIKRVDEIRQSSMPSPAKISALQVCPYCSFLLFHCSITFKGLTILPSFKGLTPKILLEQSKQSPLVSCTVTTLQHEIWMLACSRSAMPIFPTAVTNHVVNSPQASIINNSPSILGSIVFDKSITLSQSHETFFSLSHYASSGLKFQGSVNIQQRA